MTAAVVDTSVWIDFLRGTVTKQERLLREMIRSDTPVVITPQILQELLMGVRRDEEAERLRRTLLAFDILEQNQVAAATGAAELYRTARRQGVTVRKSVDCLIAWQAMEAGLPVLHRDRDFDALSRVSELSVLRV